ncbi:MAG: DUF2029 domain-containing protein [Candidatus Methanomethylophilaceae archaeon]|nr:DUF2029 domain-containing protein [Candidatus Methanomethylophilaceae archaeon]
MRFVDRVERFFQIITDGRRFFIILAVVMAVCYAYVGLTALWEDVYHYWFNIDYFYTSGLIPYRDYVFEYPPFSLVIFLIPRIFAWDPESFRFLYGLFACLCYVGAAWLILDMMDDNGKAKRYVCLLLLVIPLLSMKFIMTRNDVFAGVIVILALWLFRKDKAYLACAVLAAGAMIKMYPALLMVPILCEYLSTKDYRKVLLCVVSFGLVCLLINMPFMIIDYDTAFNYLTYHSDRYIQIESVIASPILLAHLFGLTTIHSDWSAGSNNMTGEIPDLLSPYLFYVMAAALVSVSLLILYRYIRTRTDGNSFYLLCLSSITLVLTFVTFNKVYSAQYMIWIMMLCPMLVMTVCESEKDRAMVFCLLFGITSTIAYLFFHWDFINFRFAIPETIKNLMTVAFFVYCIMLLSRSTKGTGEVSDTVKNNDPDIEK